MTSKIGIKLLVAGSHNIKFHKQYYFEDLKPNNYPLKFDFAIFNPNIILIEY